MKSKPSTWRTIVLMVLLLSFASIAHAQTIELYWDTPGGYEEQAGYRAVADRFEELNPGIQVHTNLGLSIEELIVSITAGTPPDIAFSTIEDAPYLITNDMLLPLEAWIERDGFDIEDFYHAIITPYRFDGSKLGQGPLYGIPKESAVRGTYFNVTLFQEAGLPLPSELAAQGNWNWDTWLESARSITRIDGSGEVTQWGWVRDMRLMYQLMWVWANGGDIADDLLNPTEFTFASDNALEALEFYADAAHVYRVAPAEWFGGSSGLAPFTEGRAGLAQNGPWHMATLDANESLEYGTVQSPQSPNGGRANLLSGSIFAIPRGAKDPELAWKLLRFASSREGQQIMTEVAKLQPARRSLVEAFLNTKPEVDMMAFLGEVEVARPFFAMPGSNELNELLTPYLEQVAVGKISVRGMVDAVKPQADAIIARATQK